MSAKSEFLKFLNELMISCPQAVLNSMSDEVKSYIEIMCNETEVEKPLFTENGKKVLIYMKENTQRPLWKAKDIAEGLMVPSRTISGAMRKLVSDGFVEKNGTNPIIYALTEKGKNIEIND